MTFRTVNTDVWGDDWFGDLPDDGKVLWFCLFTNDRANICGLYKISLRELSFYTGIGRGRLIELLATFEQGDGKPKAIWRDGWVFVVNMKRLQLQKTNPKVELHIEKHLATVPNGYLKTMYAKTYPTDTPSDEQRYPTDTPSDEYRKTETETETGNGKQEVDRAARSSAYQSFERITGQTINPANAGQIDELFSIKGIEEFERALRVAVENNARYPLRYARQVLTNEDPGPKRNGKSAPTIAEVLGLDPTQPISFDLTA